MSTPAADDAKGITVFARLKPTKKPFAGVRLSTEVDDEAAAARLEFDLARAGGGPAGVLNNRKELYKFKFKHIFPRDCSQDDVFRAVAAPVIDSVLDGYNGTVFAYGQTGSGKTFTITGGAERYADRGIIPRTLAYIFEQFGKRSDRSFEAKVSYLEIYNEVGFDLLDPDHEITKMEDLPKVELLDTGDGEVFLKNLSQNPVSSEEDALNALFVGDTNRMIAETPMNQASTRSHCIFTIHLSSRPIDGSTIRRAKLHLVDLAGSERIGKTGVAGTLATEAKYINLSLHYLEQVIVALSEKSRSHIPYRNSMMTSVLRDSLGGNCKTTMIATLSVQKSNIDESISTCKFAQRVALIKNNAALNEEQDPAVLIARLRKEVARLKAELALQTGSTELNTSPLDPTELLQCRQLVQQFVADSSAESELVLGDMRKIQVCFQTLKAMATGRPLYQDASPQESKDAVTAARHVSSGADDAALGEASEDAASTDVEVSQLRDLLKQRDNEISILVAKLKKERTRASNDTSGRTSDGRQTAPRSQDLSAAVVTNPEPPIPHDEYRGGIHGSHPQDHSTGSGQVSEAPAMTAMLTPAAEPQPLASEAEREAAYKRFSEQYTGRFAIHDQKSRLKELYTEAKALGADVNQARKVINGLKASIQRCRLEVGVSELVDSSSPAADLADTEAEYRAQLEDEKRRYKQSVSSLKAMKKEIEHLQHLLERAKVQMHRDFESWFANGERNTDVAAPSGLDQRVQSRVGGRPKAWGTPPISPIASDSAPVVVADLSVQELENGQAEATPAASIQDRPAAAQASSYSGLGGDADGDVAAFFAARDAMRNR